jgi:outer membrane beta-barrel protein
MKTNPLRYARVLTALAACSFSALAADAPSAASPSTSSDQVVLPQVDRRDVRVPRFPSNDFELGAFAGSYSVQNFGSHPVGGLRFGYHINEDVFVEAVLAQSSANDAAFRQILPGGVFPKASEKLVYYNLSAGYNVLPGEVFIGAKNAKPMALYLIGGVGSTTLNQQRQSTFNLGAGWRIYLNDHVALQLDAREHMFSFDLLGKRQSTKNPELTAGVTTTF